MEHRKKWETAKKLGLCYRCLGKGHLSDSCTWSRECGIDRCKDKHHWLLHEEKIAQGSMEGKADTPLTEENKSSTMKQSKNMHRGALPCVLFQSFRNMGRDI